ncbi:MAG: formylglycine-generating enzyme family protein [Bacteroidaceae bacterium]|nr:formylglycine-generating enzyme family protein [Bacteroidaceae bacterium]
MKLSIKTIFLLGCLFFSACSSTDDLPYDVAYVTDETATDYSNIDSTVDPESGSTILTVPVKAGVNIKLIVVEGGSFTMGSSNTDRAAFDDEKTLHEVTLRTFAIGQTEVTQQLWNAVMDNNPSVFKGDDLPVENVTWKDCQTFITRLNTITGLKFRLPTEAQWEYAARGGKKARGTTYSGSNQFEEVGWCHKNAKRRTHPVAQLQPNEIGIYDMTGNVFEWCSDIYGAYSSLSQENPAGLANGSNRVSRGGCFSYSESRARLTLRNNLPPSTKHRGLGLRLVL